MKTIAVKIPVKVKREEKHFIVWNKRYNISGYGNTIKEAVGMFRVCADEALRFVAPNKVSGMSNTKIK